MPDAPVLYLVDGSSYLYRAFHALPNLSNADNQPTGAIFGVANMLRRLAEQYAPSHAAVIFDAPGKNFRHALYTDYKANRPPMPPDLRNQIEPLHELVRALGWPLISVPEVEADDVIATLCRQAGAAGMRVLISSGDKDLAQLVGDNVMLEDTMQDKRYDRQGVIDRYGVPPEQVADLLALTGDTSDNIPGVDKVGPKTAAKWLQQYGSLRALIEDAGEIGGRAGENLRAALPQLPLSRQLVALKSDVALALAPAELRLAAPDRQQLTALLKQFGFASWLRQLEEGGEEAGEHRPDTRMVISRQDLQALLDTVQSAALTAFDTETTSLDPMRADLVGLAFSTEADTAWYVPLTHADQMTEFDRDEALRVLTPWLEDEQAAKVGQHLKYDLNVLHRADITLRGIRHDTMLASYVYHSTATRHDMDSLAARYLKRQTISFETVAGKGKQQLTFDQVPVAAAAEYAGEDAEVTLCLHHELWPRLQQQPGPTSVYRDVEIPLIPVLARMERCGILVDRLQLQRQSAELAAKMTALEARAHALAGHVFNLGSPRQLQTILFDELGIPARRKTPKGQPSTAEDVLHELALEHELPGVILQHRAMAKLKNTYTDRLPERINPETGRVHTSFHQAVAATGRLSSMDPNLQNIPIRTIEGRRIRKAFVAPAGCLLLAADYSQIELRIMAHLSADEKLLQAFAEGEDIHRATAAEVFGLGRDQVSAEQRRAAKAINFGLMYGMSSWGLARQLETGREDAQAYIDRYFERYPGVRDYMDRTRAQAREQGYVETLFGRRLWLDEIRSRNMQRRQAAERAAINAPMQGSAADIIKRAMLAVDGWLQAENVPARLLLQVHDELVLEVEKPAIDAVREAVCAHMRGAAELAVVLEVDAGTGPDWDSAH